MAMTALRRKYTEENAKRVQAARVECKPIAFTGCGGIGTRAMRDIKAMTVAFEAQAPLKTAMGDH